VSEVDVLGVIDDVLSDHVTTVEGIGTDLFAEAMDSVRDLIDGDRGTYDYATTATWVPPERKEPEPEPRRCSCALCNAYGRWGAAYLRDEDQASQPTEFTRLRDASRAVQLRTRDEMLALLGFETPAPRPVVMGVSPDFVIVDETFEWATMVDGPSTPRRPRDQFTIDVPFAGQTLEAMGIELPVGARLTYETTPILGPSRITSAVTYDPNDRITQEDLTRWRALYEASWPTPEPP
jgi:hypothetical protein